MESHESFAGSRKTAAKIALLGSYLPRKCGIATFTSDLQRALQAELVDGQCLVAAVSDTEAGYSYPDEVRFEILQSDEAAYLRAAHYLNGQGVDLVCLQHEFGIFGGSAGSYILRCLEELKAPIVITLHTVLQTPDAEQERVMKELIRLSSRLVVMTTHTESLLLDRYAAPAEKIDRIAHGIPDTPWLQPDLCKKPFGVEGKKVLLTFGLLSPGKGIEVALRALPEIVANFPNLTYIVLGATHPHLVREQGEAYREKLARLAEELGVADHVIFTDRFVELDELTEYIAAADIYITPYLNEAQAVSGTLAYAFGCGKPVVSTPYWHAKELLEGNKGILVSFGDSAAIAQAVNGLLGDSAARDAMASRAYQLGRSMLWSRSAEAYHASFRRAFQEQTRNRREALKAYPGRGPLPELQLQHLERLSDSTGIFQHALFAVPNFEHGYCTDDNARSLILTVLLAQDGPEQARLQRLRSSYLAFMAYAFHPPSSRFRNFMSFDRCWQEEIGSEDSQGRSIWALGVCISGKIPASERGLAEHLFDRALPQVADFKSLRAMAFALLGIVEFLRRFHGDRRVAGIRDKLLQQLFDHFQAGQRPDWIWCESYLCYDNPRLPQALIAAGHQLGREDMVETGLGALSWLMDLQQDPTSTFFRPIGSDSVYHRGQQRPFFDQQPVDVWASVSACLEAHRVSSEPVWLERAHRAFAWFLGANDLGLAVYDESTGGCRDGLHNDRVNENQGAESTLAFLLSLAELRSSGNGETT